MSTGLVIYVHRFIVVSLPGHVNGLQIYEKVVHVPKLDRETNVIRFLVLEKILLITPSSKMKQQL